MRARMGARALRAIVSVLRYALVYEPEGSQILLEDPSGHVIELFQPAAW
jgi:hypothetical protein